MKKFLLAFLCILFNLCTICEGQGPVIPKWDKKNIEKRVDNGVNTGVVVGIISSQGTTFYSYGVKSLDSKEIVVENSVFSIASISKTFTGILLADVVVKGELNLNEPLQNLLPNEIRAPTYNGQSIQLVHLANHTSSLPDLPSNLDQTSLINPFANYSEEQMYNFLKDYELTRNIGSEYEYSNFGMGLLGHLLANKHKANYEELLTEKVTKPLKLQNTSTGLTPQMEKDLARGHKIGVEVPIWNYLSPFAGAAGIRSTAKDMLNYLSYNMGLANSSLYPAMQLSHKNTRKEGQIPMVGLGWQIMERDDLEIIFHDGESGGYCSFLGFTRGGDKGVVVLTNSNAGVTDIGMHLLDANFPLGNPKPPIGARLRKVIESQGMEKAHQTYWELKENHVDDFDFSEDQLDMLAQFYVWDQDTEKAISLFELNIKAFPNYYDAYNSYGDALMQRNDTTKAIASFKKSIELYSGNFYGTNKLNRLGVDPDSLTKKVIVEDLVLESYVGNFELVPGFVLTISKHGNQLKAQATGKAKHLIYPKSDSIFYFKVLPAEITFNKNEMGKIISLTLVQEGEKVIGKKIKEY